MVSPGVPEIIQGGLAIDDRGTLRFVNACDLSGVKRFYTVTNHRAGFVRAWHAHRFEAKFITVVRGAALVGAVAIDDWTRPSRDAAISRYTLSWQSPAVLYVPPGYANGFMSLTKDALLLFLSTATLEQSRTDDVRFDARYWNIWDIIER